MELRVVYLPGNQCYAVLRGDAIIPIGPWNQCLHTTKKELRAVLKRFALTIGPRNVVQSITEEC